MPATTRIGTSGIADPDAEAVAALTPDGFEVDLWDEPVRGRIDEATELDGEYDVPEGLLEEFNAELGIDGGHWAADIEYRFREPCPEHRVAHVVHIVEAIDVACLVRPRPGRPHLT